MTALIQVSAHADAPPEVVWDVLTRSADWADWSDFSDSVRERDGVGHPDGVGSVRAGWVAGLVAAREEVVTFDPDEWRYAYVAVSGVPLRDYRGTVTLAADGAGTRITWEATGRSLLPIPGADLLNAALLRLVLGRQAGLLARAAERQTAAASH